MPHYSPLLSRPLLEAIIFTFDADIRAFDADRPPARHAVLPEQMPALSAVRDIAISSAFSAVAFILLCSRHFPPFPTHRRQRSAAETPCAPIFPLFYSPFMPAYFLFDAIIFLLPPLLIAFDAFAFIIFRYRYY